MTAKQLICELFDLPKDETIFEDFGCAIKRGILHHGRMFVSENHVCFYANIMGLKTKVRSKFIKWELGKNPFILLLKQVIPIKDITSVEKKAVLGFIQNALEITTKTTKFFFCSFSQRNTAYRLIYALWKGVPIDSQEGGPDDEDEGEKTETNDAGISTGETTEEEIGEINFLQTDSVEKKELRKAVLPVSVDKIFDLLFSDNATYSIVDHFKSTGASELVLTKWTENAELGGFTRELNMKVKVGGIGMPESARVYKVQTYKKENNKLIISSMSKTFDVPYSNTFQIEERWEVAPDEANSEKSTVKFLGWLVFIKSTLFRKIIEEKTIEGIKKDIDLYINNIRERKILEGRKTEATGAAQSEKDNKKAFEFEKSKALEIDEKLMSKPLNASDNLEDELNLLKKRGARDEKTGRRKSSAGEGSVYQEVQDNMRISKINAIFLLILVITLLFVIVLLSQYMKTLLGRLDAVDRKIEQILLEVYELRNSSLAGSTTPPITS